jgi:hypothetical protein
MSITLNLNTEKLKSKTVKPIIHYIPAKISENCTANVQNYFDSYTSTENNGNYLLLTLFTKSGSR